LGGVEVAVGFGSPLVATAEEVRTVIRTTRLDLVPMDRAELAAIRDGARRGRRWARDYPAEGDVLLAELALSSDAPPVSEQRPWGPLQVRERESDLAVGGAGFKGPPDPDGEVEIGYGLAESARSRGLATEAVGSLVAFARDRGVGAVTAETDAQNLASQRVLLRVGFEEVGRSDRSIRWRWVPPEPT
jgi:RimJ/RimL family protein N-acetyltransferase